MEATRSAKKGAEAIEAAVPEPQPHSCVHDSLTPALDVSFSQRATQPPIQRADPWHVCLLQRQRQPHRL